MIDLWIIIRQVIITHLLYRFETDLNIEFK